PLRDVPNVLRRRRTQPRTPVRVPTRAIGKSSTVLNVLTRTRRVQRELLLVDLNAVGTHQGTWYPVQRDAHATKSFPVLNHIWSAPGGRRTVVASYRQRTHLGKGSRIPWE